MDQYQGMRWFKADFQVQTPEDSKHWSDTDLRLGNPRRTKAEGVFDESEISSKAQAFLKRCHELELQIVGITDHNFSGQTDPRDWFLTHLIEQNKSIAAELGREMIHILPGFEVDIGYHVLCLFEPAKKSSELERVNKVLIQLGLPESQRFERGLPTPLRRDDSPISLAKLLKIVQDDNNGIVIAAHADQEDGLLQRPSNRPDYQLPGLLAVEVTQYPLGQKISDILTGKNRDWARPGKQPAYVQSSDAKSLKVDEHDNPKPNSLGYRHTWVKCSRPSIAALKQAFLDSGSRISLEKMSPSERETFPRIVSITVKGLKYLEDQKVVFSPNLNTLIGARGTGKSTILELLRIMFARDETGAFSEKAKVKAQRAKQTFTPDTEILVEWEGIPGQVDVLRYSPSDELSLIEGTAHDLSAYLRHLPIQFYSQQQLSELTAPGGQYQLLGLIDEICAAELEKLQGEERTVVADIKRLFAAQDQMGAIEDELNGLKQELVEIDRQWQARKDVQGEATAYQRAIHAKRYFQSMSDGFEKDVNAVDKTLGSLTPTADSPVAVAESWPHSGWFTEQTAKVATRRAIYQQRLNALLAEMRNDFANLFSENQQWHAISADLDAAHSNFISACTAKGIQPSDVSRLQDLDRVRQTKQRSLEDKELQWKALEKTPEELEHSLSRLSDIWEEQCRLRRQTALEITEKTNKTICVIITPMANKPAFMLLWGALEPDRRSRLGKAWDEIGEHLFSNFLNDPSPQPNPWEHIAWVMRDINRLPSILQQFSTELPPYLASVQDKWRTLRVSRVPDLIDIELYRQDHTLIGSIEGNQLSEGQRNTAILNLLLVRGDGPIVIDQPEDEVDTSFIYKDLVPLLRQSKTQRQLILATHNANLPVNADSEFVYALMSEGGKGRVLAQGGTDLKQIADAILDIMEGSEEAFKRRSEKYHF
ncbi:AAA family ATPase [Pseudomonas sp. sp1636]|uniref:TrlF family AAA-like ATPase n=1 Tax=Pseudomonas sp. sp1636 TaxID=3036707 RepID=UPI0025A5F254|nr:AAA family ATPase [Pseudomonas sp. sp1636]MDM8351018.1 AAA family ATPase [Pseudomonas sp. sp1636]